MTRPPVGFPFVPIGGVDFPAHVVLPGNITFWGSPFSGKSLLMSMLMKALLPFFHGFVFDEKQDLLALLHGILPADRIANLHPFDANGLAWDLKRDLASPLARQAFANALIPEGLGGNAGNSRFWDSNARDIVEAVEEGLAKLDILDLYNLICALSPDHIYDVLRLTERGQRVVANVLTSKATAVDRPQDLISTISSHVDRLIPVALAMKHHQDAGRTFSLNDWVSKMTTQTCIRVARDARYAPSLDPLLGIMLGYTENLILARPGDIPIPDFLFFLDEGHELARMWRRLPQFMALSRSKGVSTILATQTLSGLRLALDSRDAAQAISELSRTTVFLRSDSPEVGRMLCDLAGKQTVLRRQPNFGGSENDGYQSGSNVSHGYSGVTLCQGKPTSWRDVNFSTQKSDTSSFGRGYNGSTTLVLQTEDVAPPYALLNLPQPSPTSGLSCFCRVASAMWAPRIDPRWIELRTPKAALIDEPPLDIEHTTFKRWSRAESARLFGRERGGFFDAIGRSSEPTLASATPRVPFSDPLTPSRTPVPPPATRPPRRRR